MTRSIALRRIIIALLGCALVACVPASSIGRLQQALHGATGGPASAAPGSAEAAIQLVIQRGNFEQEQAIANRNPSVMRDTSTDAYYQDLTQTNQDMLQSGVTSIKLDGLDWGPITVNGATASATTDETWTANYSDGTSDQSTDRNVYSLVQQNDQWLIQADEHPDSSGGSPSPNAQGGQTPSTPIPQRGATPTPNARGGVGPFGRSTPTPQPSGSPVPTATPPPAGSAEAAIQAVVQRGDHEQEQAIASGDSSAMRDTSTDSYYQQLSQDNQDMLQSGVTGIKLQSIDWGTITINGNTATATAYETWSTTYQDGTTDQEPRDRNVYTLAQQSDGSWKIQSDDHPDDTSPLPSRGIQV